MGLFSKRSDEPKEAEQVKPPPGIYIRIFCDANNSPASVFLLDGNGESITPDAPEWSAIARRWKELYPAIASIEKMTSGTPCPAYLADRHYAPVPTAIFASLKNLDETQLKVALVVAFLFAPNNPLFNVTLDTIATISGVVDEDAVADTLKWLDKNIDDSLRARYPDFCRGLTEALNLVH